MYLQKVIGRKARKKIVFWRLKRKGRKWQDPESDPDPLVRGRDQRILIRTKMS
jgi:hypothetical protein